MASCQTKAQNGNSNSTTVFQVENSNTEKVDANTKKVVEVQPFDSLTTKPSSIDDIDSKVGVVDENKDEVCLTIHNSNLKEGEEISVIFLNKPQSVQMAIVQKKLSSRCSGNQEVGLDDGLEDSYYSLKFSQPTDEIVYTALGLISPNKVVINKGIASVDLDGDKKAEYFRKCTNIEGILFTVWSGKPLVGKRIWVSYYYLGYDVEPNCKKKDEEIED